METEERIRQKEEALRWIISIFGAAILYFILALGITSVYHPDIDHLTEAATRTLAETWDIHPEPTEALLFRVAVIFIPLSLVTIYLLTGKWKPQAIVQQKKIWQAISVVTIATIVLLIISGFMAENTSDNTSRYVALGTEGIDNTVFQFYFNNFFLGSYFWIYTITIVPLISYLFLVSFNKPGWHTKKIVSTSAYIFGYTIVSGTLICIAAMNTFVFPYSVENRYDFAAVYYSMTQVYAGVPMLVDRFTDTYGLYPHFLQPLFKVTGLSVLSFSLIMSLLLTIAFLLNFYVVSRFAKNKIILFAGFTTLLFFGYLDRKLINHFDNYFALFPIRYIIPAVLLLLAYKYVVKPTRLLYYSTTVIMSLFILWNPEIGLTCYLSWAAMNCYNDFYTAEGKVNLKRLTTHIATAMIIAVATFYLFKGLIYISYGAAPDFSMLWHTISVFSVTGFGLIPMTAIHPWNILALIIMLGLLFAIARWSRKDITPKSSIVFLLSLVSIGYFTYFQGRSHNAHLTSAMAYPILLLTILGDDLWNQVRQTKDRLLSSLFVIFLFLVSFSVIELFYNIPRIASAVSQSDDKAAYSNIIQYMEGGRQLLERTSAEHEKVLILSQKKHQPLLLSGNKRISAAQPGLIDMFYLDDLHNLENTIRDSSFSLYLEVSDELPQHMLPSYAAMAAGYKYADVEQTLVWLKKRAPEIPNASFLNNRSACLFHRKYNDDTAGINQRIKDASGDKPVATGPAFSVEVIFKDYPQMIPQATLIGNVQDSSGFAIGKVFNSEDDFFAINGTGLVLPSKEKGSWTYLAMNVFPDHVALYRNGVHITDHPLPQPARSSARPLSIGNLGDGRKIHYFVGPIAEVNISGSPIDSAVIKNTWNEFSHVNH